MADQPLFFDNAPFLGRIEEQSRFREALRQVMRDNSFTAKAKDWVSMQDPPPPFVFLLYGEGGMGKSTLAKQLRHIATTEAEFKGHFETLWLDWEARKPLDLKLVARDSVSPETVFEHIYAICRDAGFSKEFDQHEAALKTRVDAEKKVAQALAATAGEGPERYGTLRELGAKGLAWLIFTGLPGGAYLPQEPTAKAFEAIIGGGAEGIARTRDAAGTLLRSRLRPDEFDLFTLPNESLARTLAIGLGKAAQKKPIILTLDTYEIADRADVWLRVVIKRAGPNVIWVIAGRDNLAESRKYGQSYQQGYRADFGNDRLRVYPMGEFSVGDVAEYFKYRVPERPLDEATAQAIHYATLGNPLAVKEAAAIWQNPTRSLSDIAGNGSYSRDREKVVQTMTERFLLHAWDDPQERQQLYALALAYQPDVDLLAAMLDTSDLEVELVELERRHSFVFVADMKLHDKVSVWIREYLMAEVRRKSKDVRDLHQRAIDCLANRLAQREALLPSLEDRVRDRRWSADTTALMYHWFWLDETEGWKTLLPSFISGLAYDSIFASSLLHVAQVLTTTFTREGRRRLKTLMAGSSSNAAPSESTVLLAELESTKSLWPNDGLQPEREKILGLRRGKILEQQERFDEAKALYEQLEQGLSQINKTLLRQLSNAWDELGVTLRQKGNLSEAIYAYERAISLNPRDFYAYNNLGNVYSDLGRFADAIDALEKAIEFEPITASVYNNLGGVYTRLGRYEEAIAQYQIAVDLDPIAPAPYSNLGNVAYRLGRYNEAIAALQRAIEIAPNSASAQVMLLAVYRKLRRDSDFATRVTIVRDLVQGENEYIRACFESVSDNIDEALSLLRIALEKDPRRRDLVLNDPLFDSIRSEPRFLALISEQPISPSRNNPYVYGDPVKKTTAFYGRQSELEVILESITKSTKQDILLVGERRTGKTSLLYQLRNRLKSSSRFIPVYLALYTSRTNNADDVLDLILNKVISNLVTVGIINAKEWDHKKYPSFYEFVDKIEAVVKAAKFTREFEIVLLLDEADYLLKVDQRVQNVLRATFQSEVGASIRAVVAGTTDLSIFVSQHSSPFYNHFRFVPLRPLKLEEARKLIVEPATRLGYTYSASAVKQIMEFSGNQPYYCQFLCFEAFDHATSRGRKLINDDDVKIAAEKVITDTFPTFISSDGYWTRATSQERDFLINLVEGHRPTTIKRTEIMRLLDWQLINELDDQYSLASTLVTKWVVLAMRG